MKPIKFLWALEKCGLNCSCLSGIWRGIKGLKRFWFALFKVIKAKLNDAKNELKWQIIHCQAADKTQRKKNSNANANANAKTRGKLWTNNCSTKYYCQMILLPTIPSSTSWIFDEVADKKQASWPIAEKTQLNRRSTKLAKLNV